MLAKTKYKKITLNLPENLLREATRATGDGITETVRKGLELLRAQEFFETALKKRGKLKFNIRLTELRQD